MAKKTLAINSVLPGISPSQFFASQGQFLGSIAVDPDYPLTQSGIRTSGVLVPTRYEKFSGANVNAPVISIITTPKTSLVYVVLNNGRLISYSSSLGSETLIGTVAGGNAEGAFYYNNYIYITGTGASANDVSRYGPLNGVAALTDGVWTGATLGSQTALTNTTYPTIRGVRIPNHWGFVHVDGAAYFVDFLNGQGYVHKIKTTRSAVEGDTNAGSTYAALTLPLGPSFFPTTLSNYSTDIAVITMNTTDTVIDQGKSSIFLWDAFNQAETAYREIDLPDPMATAIKDYNGAPVIWTGNAVSGVRMSQYLGGQVVKQIGFMEEGITPFPGAVTTEGNRLLWGAFTTYLATTASVFALGSKDANIPMGLHNVIRTTSSGSNPIVTAIKFVQQASNITPRAIVAWADGSGYGIDKLSTSATYNSIWRSNNFQIGKTFSIEKIRIPLGATVTTFMNIDVDVFIDDGSTTHGLSAISPTSHGADTRYAVYKSPELDIIGRNNFYIQLRWNSGTGELPVQLPIQIEIEEFDDEPYA